MVLLVVAIMVPNPVAGARLVLQKEIKQFLQSYLSYNKFNVIYSNHKAPGSSD
jgi:hypothetical protein